MSKLYSIKASFTVVVHSSQSNLVVTKMKIAGSQNNFNFALILSLVLSLVCLVIVFVGGWHFQSSLVEEKVKTEAQEAT